MVLAAIVVHNGGTHGSCNGASLETSQNRHLLASQAGPRRPASNPWQERGKSEPRHTRCRRSEAAPCAQALVELEQRWANLRAPPKPISEREAHESVAAAYEWWINLHRDNPSEQTVWETKYFSELWQHHDGSKYRDLPVLEEFRQKDADGYYAVLTMEQFCREQVEKLLRDRGLNVDWLSLSKIEKAYGAAIQRASLDLAGLAKGGFASPPSSQPAMSVAQHRPNTVGANEPVTFETLIGGWAAERRPMQKTIYEYKRALRNLAAFLGQDDATRLSSQHLVAWKAKMIEAGLHPKTILDAKLAPVRAILQWAVDNDRLPFNPATRVRLV
jgi:hypothetical protein